MKLHVAHLIALVPGIVVICHYPRRLPSSFKLLAMAFAISWVGDLVAKNTGGSWAGFYVWVPVQMYLAFFAVELNEWRRVAAFAPLAVLIPLSVWLTFPGPEVLIMVVGSTAVVLLAKGDMRWPVYLYFGFGTLIYFPMVTGSHFMDWWYGYQASRLGAFIVFVSLLIRNQRGRVHVCPG